MKAKSKESNHFESGMTTLSQLADQLESGDLDLDGSLKAFEEGVRLYRQLQEQLENARMRIEVIASENRTVKTLVEEDHVDEL